MSPVEFKKMPCRPVEFKGQGPLSTSKLLSSKGITKKRTMLIPAMCVTLHLVNCVGRGSVYDHRSRSDSS